jgi:hypothetical protein
MKAVYLHIDRIVIDGLPEIEQRRFAGALEERLRAWAQSGAAGWFAGDARMRISTLDAGQLRPDVTASQAAMQVVRSIEKSVDARGRSGGSRGLATSSGGEARGHV